MDMFQRHTANHDKLSQCLAATSKINSITVKSRLWKLYENTRDAWNLLDSEFVECRRRQKITHKYTELEAKFLECVTTYEHWQLMAVLSY